MQTVNWVESNKGSYHTLFPFGKDLYEFSIWKITDHQWQLKSLKIRNADYIYLDSGVFDDYYVPANLIIKILSEIDYTDSRTLVTESNSIKSIRRFVNKRIQEFLKDAPSIPIERDRSIKQKDYSDEELIMSSSSATDMLTSIHNQALSE